MKIRYFEDTDTALFEIGSGVPAETKEVSEGIYLDLDASGHLVSITVEHASEQSDLSEISFLRVNRTGQAALSPA